MPGDEKSMNIDQSTNNEGNWYLLDKPDRLKRIHQHGMHWIDLIKKSIDIKKQCDQAESKYFAIKHSFYNSTNVAIVDGDITTAESIGYHAELKEIDRKIIDLKKRINAESNVNRHRRNSNRNRDSKDVGRNSNRNAAKNGNSRRLKSRR